jgi:hypothetical protein
MRQKQYKSLEHLNVSKNREESNTRGAEKKFRSAERPGQRDRRIFEKIAPSGGFIGGQQGPQGDQAQRAGHKEGLCVHRKAGSSKETQRSPGLDAEKIWRPTVKKAGIEKVDTI